MLVILGDKIKTKKKQKTEKPLECPWKAFVAPANVFAFFFSP
jgi:hypothetical protein